MKILLLAGRKSGYFTLRKLLEKGKNVVGVFTMDYEHLNNEDYYVSDFQTLCDEYEIPLFVTDKLNAPDNLEKIKELHPEVGVSAGWRRLVRDPFLSIPNRGFFNIHMSDLPKYRGFASTSWAIYNGDKECGVTCHFMKSGVADDGDILLKKFIPINSGTSIKHLIEDSADLKASMVLEVINAFEKDTISPEPQGDHVINSFPRLPRDGAIDWNKSALDIDRQIRATTRPYPGSYTYFLDQAKNVQKLFIWESEILKDHEDFVGVPGHVIRNDKESGLSYVLCGEGILGIKLAEWQHEEGDFRPGEVWKSVQMRLGVTNHDLCELALAKGSPKINERY